MKKLYQKPDVCCEEFTAETALCNCIVINKSLSATEACSYFVPELDKFVFTDYWESCKLQSNQYCVQVSVVSVFGS